MSKEYLFDKRKRKRAFIKYLIIFLIGFVPIVIFNVYVGKYLSNGLVIFLDCIFLLIIVLIGNLVANKYYEKKDKRLEQKMKERENLKYKKELILNKSYKQNSRQIDQKYNNTDDKSNDKIKQDNDSNKKNIKSSNSTKKLISKDRRA